jgi:hypothetical protein
MLKTLLLNEWCVAVGFGALAHFLQHTPVLEKLVLQLRRNEVYVIQVLLLCLVGGCMYHLLICIYFLLATDIEFCEKNI